MYSILFVDDDETLLDIGKLSLERSGRLRIDTAASAEMAIEKFFCGKFDGIISDCRMPEMNGIDLLKNIRRESGQIPFMLFTVAGKKELPLEAVYHGTYFFLQKAPELKSQFDDLECLIIQTIERERAIGDLMDFQKQKTTVPPGGNHKITDTRAFPESVIVRTKSGLKHTMTRSCTELEQLLEKQTRELEKARVSLGTETAHRRQTEQVLHETEERFGELYYNIRDPVVFLKVMPDGRFGRILEVNEYACTKSGYTREELLLLSAHELAASPDIDEMERLLKEMEKNAREQNFTIFEGTFLGKDGKKIPIESTILTSHFKGEAAVLVIARDITKRRQAEDALKQANKKLMLLSSITRHDILNQLTLLTGYHALAMKRATDPTMRTYLEKEKHAAGTIQELISFAKDYEEIGVQVPQWQDVKTIVQRATGRLDSGPVTVSAEIGPCEVYADSLLEKVFFNLIENAIRHGERVTRVSFYTETSIDQLTIVCEDDGIGIPDGEKENIFCRQYFKHTGFGMSLAREILAITGLTIRETGMVGKGARFEITVPEGSYRFTSGI